MSSRRPLNPAFAAAHGLAETTGSNDDEDVIGLPRPIHAAKASSGGTNSKRLELVLKQARHSGKLQASNIGLKAPLPEALFDFRAGIVVDLSLESSQSAANNWLHGEETLNSVDLSDNDLAGSLLDERVLRYEQVQILRWKRCGLVGMEVNLSSLGQLAILDLAGNRLTEFCVDWVPETIQELNLSSNALSGLSSGSGGKCLEYLLLLDLSHNQLDHLDFMATTNGVSFPRLNTFHCHHNRLKSFSCDSFESSKNTLQILDASHNQLHGDTRLDLSHFSQLQSLLLSFNRLTVMPCVPFSANRLDLTTNKIKSIKGMLPLDGSREYKASLFELLLHDNYLLDLDAETIAHCEELQRLDLSANKLKTLPYQLGFLAKLQRLSLTGNPLVTFKASEIESTKAIMEKLRNRAPKSDVGSRQVKRTILSSPSVLVNNRSIHLVGTGSSGDPDLEQLVMELKGNPTLAFGLSGQVLLDKNNLDSIPDDLLPQLPKLTELSLQGNAFKALPPSLATSCPLLTRLTMSGNHISQLDDIFQSGAKLPWALSLTHLDLSNNRLTELSEDVLKQLSNLQVLSLSHNKLTSVENWSSLPQSLTKLDLSENAIEQADDLILLLGAHCSRLEALLLHHNYIRRIPSTIGLLQERCPNLKWLDLKGNPQHAIRPEILTKPTQDQLTYLMNRLTVAQKAATKAQIEDLLQNATQQEQCSGTSLNASRDTVETLVNVGESIHTIVTKDGETKPSIDGEEAAKVEALLVSLRTKISEFENQLGNASLSQAKRYAVKKALAMERSKLIREERKLGLRK